MKTGTTTLFFFAVAAAACGHEYNEPSTTTTTASRAGASPNDPAIDAIARGRCAREARCNNVGAGRHYVSHDGCITQLRGEGMNDLTPSSCPGGVDQRQLDKCLSDIRGEHCENVLDTLSRVSSCSTSNLCSR